jgi:hypothetical protein
MTQNVTHDPKLKRKENIHNPLTQNKKEFFFPSFQKKIRIRITFEVHVNLLIG